MVQRISFGCFVVPSSFYSRRTQDLALTQQSTASLSRACSARHDCVWPFYFSLLSVLEAVGNLQILPSFQIPLPVIARQRLRRCTTRMARHAMRSRRRFRLRYTWNRQQLCRNGLAARRPLRLNIRLGDFFRRLWLHWRVAD